MDGAIPTQVNYERSDVIALHLHNIRDAQKGLHAAFERHVMDDASYQQTVNRKIWIVIGALSVLSSISGLAFTVGRRYFSLEVAAEVRAQIREQAEEDRSYMNAVVRTLERKMDEQARAAAATASERIAGAERLRHGR